MFHRSVAKIFTLNVLRHPGLVRNRLITSSSFCLQAKKSWIPTEDEPLQKVTTQALIHEVSLEQASYFRQVPMQLRKSHIKAIAAIRDLKQNDMSLKIESVVDQNITEITIIKTTPKPGLLLAQLNSLQTPPDSTLSRIRIYNTADGELALNIYSFENSSYHNLGASPTDGSKIISYIERIKANRASDTNADDKLSKDCLDQYLSRCTASYLTNADPRRFLIQRDLYDKVSNTDGTEVHIEPVEDYVGPVGQTAGWITIVAGNIQPDALLISTLRILLAYGFDINRAHMDKVQDGNLDSPKADDSSSFVTMLRLLVSPDPTTGDSNHTGSPAAIASGAGRAKGIAADLAQLTRALRRVKWLDDDVIGLGLVQHPELGLERAEVLLALCGMLHGPLSKMNPYAFASVKSVIDVLGSTRQHMVVAAAVVDLFVDRFRTGGDAVLWERCAQRERDLKAAILKLQHDVARLVLSKLLEATMGTLRTNLFLPNRYALSFRVHPSVMSVHVPSVAAPLPFGVFFVHGKHFNAFHCRFRDIARGGLRVVTPPSADQLALESTRHYDEVFALALAQQLKNKDIPEGGAKAVVLVSTSAIAPTQRTATVRTAVKAFTDSLLDLITTEGLRGQVDYYRKDELVYLGPDEQVIPSDIQWIVDRAVRKGYPTPAAFMSSKADAGFNHKEYGVTSEGVCVYLAVALRNSLGIDPASQPFSVKITGGPDGDVAGNLIRILLRDYPSTVRIVGIADGAGVCEDPEGLHHEELLRLVHASSPITSFDRTKLSKLGTLFDTSTEEGLQRRNSMVFRVKADAFVPAGGRPNSIDSDNWRSFLDDRGQPSSRLVVEGANLFLTPEAREALFKFGGVHIIKDSSANKCGVITSSFEVAASMLLTTEEFMAVKPKLVQDVLIRLRLLAQLEADLLFKEFRNYPGALPHFSERISHAISKVKDAVMEALAGVVPGDPLFQEMLPLIQENLPQTLMDLAGERVPDRFPVQYQRNAMASALASKLVYREGIHLVEAQPLDQLAERAFLYFREDRKIQTLLKELEKSDMSNLSCGTKDRVIDLIKKGGTRTALQIF